MKDHSRKIYGVLHIVQDNEFLKIVNYFRDLRIRWYGAVEILGTIKTYQKNFVVILVELR